jgi:hypothetical protein
VPRLQALPAGRVTANDYTEGLPSREIEMRINASCRAAFLIVAFAALVSGCAGTIRHMDEVSADRVPASPRPGKAMVVFLRPSGMGYAIQSTVYDVQSSNVALVGVVAAKAKIAYEVDPGTRLFMVVGENADFMSAELLPNKTYYVRVAPRMGLWKARFGLEPVSAADLNTDVFKTDLADCRWVVKNPAADAWMSQNLQSIQSKRLDYYPEWAAKPAAERPRLAPGDGA